MEQGSPGPSVSASQAASAPAGTPQSHLDQWKIVRQQLQAYNLAKNGLPIPAMDSPLTVSHAMEFPTSALLEIARKAQSASISLNSEAPHLSSLTESKISDARRQILPPRVPLGIDPLQLLAEQRRIEAVQAESRRAVLEAEIADLLLGDGNDAQANAQANALLVQKSVESKALKLLPKQRMLREMVVKFVKKTGLFDGSLDRASSRRGKKQSLRDARLLERLEKQQKIDRTRRERQTYYDFLNAVLTRGKEFALQQKAAQQRVAKLAKAVIHHHAVVEREEQKKLERLSKERLRALKADDEEAYLKLIDQEKDTRLTHLLRQTDEFLKGLTAKVVAQQSHSPQDGMDSAPLLSDELQISADYYDTAHRVKEEVAMQPAILHGGKLKEYQLKGLQWMLSLYNNHLNGILADEMGLGKTIQTISLIAHLMERKQQNGPFLIIVPLSTMTNWSLEFEKWAPGIIKVEYKGVPGQRKAIQAQARHGKFNVMLTTYEYIIKDRSFLSKIKWLYMIIDEGHRMKNAHSKLTTVLTQYYSARFRLILTGTPLQNNLPELWALLNFVLPHIFNSSKTFDEWFNTPFANTGEKVELNEEETLLIIRRLHKVLRPFLLRRLKRDVEAELPDKVEKVIKCPMSALQQRLYSMITQRNRAEASQEPGNGQGKRMVAIRRLNNTVMQLRKICNHPFVFDEVERQINPYSVNNENLYRVAGKFELLQRILPKFQSTGHRILIFFQMTQIMTIFEDFLLMQGYPYLRLDGSTKADDRSELLKKFNEPNSPIFIFMLSTRAGGLGLNLQTADTVIIFDSDWNPHQDLQAQDRAHRIGQTKEVRIFRLITVDSIEEYILERAQFKLNLDGKVIQAGKFDQKSTNEEREAMLRAIFEGEQEKNDVDEVYNDDELNEIIARDDAEIELFRRYDEERAVSTRSRLIEASELPKVYMDLEDDDVAALAEEDQFIKGDGMSVVGGTPRRERIKQDAMAAYDENVADDVWLERLVDDDDDQESERGDSRAGDSMAQKRKRGRPRTKAVPRKAVSSVSSVSAVSISFTPSKHQGLDLDGDQLYEVMATTMDAVQRSTDEEGRYRCDIFTELPSREVYPDYYLMIARPICLNEISERIESRTAYPTLLQFLADCDLIFANAMTYNVEGSLVYEDALYLKQLVHETVDQYIEQHVLVPSAD